MCHIHVHVYTEYSDWRKTNMCSAPANQQAPDLFVCNDITQGAGHVQTCGQQHTMNHNESCI